MTLEIKNYELRPNPVEAVLITEENAEEVAEWCHGQFVQANGKVFIDVPALEGFRRANVGDSVVKVSEEKFYPLTDYTFNRRYQETQKPFTDGEGLFV